MNQPSQLPSLHRSSFALFALLGALLVWPTACGSSYSGPAYEPEETDGLPVITMDGMSHAPCAERGCGQTCRPCPEGGDCEDQPKDGVCDASGECVSGPVDCPPGSEIPESLD